MSVTFAQPTTIQQVFEELIEDDVVLIAGGQSIVALMNVGLLYPKRLVSIARINDLKGVEVSDSCIDIGALATHQELALSSDLQRNSPCLARMFSQIGNIRVRLAGTVGGNLAVGDPAQDPAVVLYAMGASIVVVAPSGERIVPIEELYTGNMATTLQFNELIARVRVPLLAERSACSYIKYRPGSQDDYGAVNVASRITVDGFLNCIDVCIAIGSLGVPIASLASAREVLIGHGLDEPEVMVPLRESVRNEVSPHTDRRGSADYKRFIAGEIAVQCVQLCLQRLSRNDKSAEHQARLKTRNHRAP